MIDRKTVLCLALQGHSQWLLTVPKLPQEDFVTTVSKQCLLGQKSFIYGNKRISFLLIWKKQGQINQNSALKKKILAWNHPIMHEISN